MAIFDLGYPPSQYQSARPGFHGTSLQAFFEVFPNDDACLEYLFRLRFGGDPICPRCGKRGRWRRYAWQKHYFHPCGGIISPMAGTALSRTHIPVQLWFYAMLHFANSAQSISSSFLARQLGVSQPTAYRISSRIRYHLAAIDHGKKLGGAGNEVAIKLVKVLRIVNRETNVQNSAMLLILCDDHQANATVIVKPRQKNMLPVLKNKTLEGSKFITDCYWTHRSITGYTSRTNKVEFIPDYYYSETNNHKNGLFQYFSLSFADQFKGVGLKNAWLYLKEYEFRYNRRANSAHTFWDMVDHFPLFSVAAFEQMRAANFIPRAGQ